MFFMKMTFGVIAEKLFELKLAKYIKYLKKMILYTKLLFLDIYFTNEGCSKFKIFMFIVPNIILLKLIFFENDVFRNKVKMTKTFCL